MGPELVAEAVALVRGAADQRDGHSWCTTLAASPAAAAASRASVLGPPSAADHKRVAQEDALALARHPHAAPSRQGAIRHVGHAATLACTPVRRECEIAEEVML
eukprot:6260387-Prymnesium_polylepis.3